MKNLIAIIFILLFSLCGIAQKKQIKKPTKKAKKTKVVEEDFTIMNGIVDDDETVEKVNEPIVIDTLFINSGKQYVFLVDIKKYDEQAAVSISIGGRADDEETELLQNFEKDAFEIKKISKHVFILFENKQTLDLTSVENSYQAFAYWGGKEKNKVQVQEGSKMATEFVSKQLGVKKESSYVTNTKKYKEEIKKLQNKNNITDKSKATMDFMLMQISYPLPKDKGEDADLFSKIIPKIKNIETYFIEGKTKTSLKSIAFNEQGQPIIVKYYNSRGEDNGTSKLIYENGMLVKKLNYEDKVETINYDNEKIIMYRNVGDANDTDVYWLQDNMLLSKSYTIMENDNFCHQNIFVEHKMVNDCEHFLINNRVWNIDCDSEKGKYPAIHTYTSFQDGEVLQFRKSKIIKKDEFTFEKYYSKAEKENQKDEFELFGTYKLNKQKLVTSFGFKKDGENRLLKIDYTFYP